MFTALLLNLFYRGTAGFNAGFFEFFDVTDLEAEVWVLLDYALETLLLPLFCKRAIMRGSMGCYCCSCCEVSV